MNNNFKKELEKEFDLLGTISKKKGPILLKIQTKTYFLAYIGYVRYNSSIANIQSYFRNEISHLWQNIQAWQNEISCLLQRKS